MEIIQKTQFAHLENDRHKLPVFLQQKLDEAAIANSMKSDAEYLNAKFEKAKKNLNEQKQKQEMKRIQKRLNYEGNLERGRIARIKKANYYKQIQTKKQKMAEEVHLSQLFFKINKAQSLGTKKVQEARNAREMEEDRKLKNTNDKLKMSNVNVEKIRDEKTKKLVQKHYSILKNVNTRQFRSQRESLKKMEDIKTKLAKAESRKQELLNEKIAKAIKTATMIERQIPEVSPGEKLFKKQLKAQQNRTLILNEKIEKARNSYKSSISDSSQTNENNLVLAKLELQDCYSIIKSQDEEYIKMYKETILLEKLIARNKKLQMLRAELPIIQEYSETSN